MRQKELLVAESRCITNPSLSRHRIY